MSALIEGRNAVAEALRAGVPIECVYLAEGASARDALPEIEALAASAGVRTKRVARRWLDERSERGAHQGVVASVGSFRFTPLAELLQSTADKSESLIVALDHITDAGNLGAIARSAEVAGADGLIVTKARSAPVTAGAYKTAAGALAWLRVSQEPNLVRALETCKQERYWVLGASEHASDTLWQVPLEGRLVVVLGSEDKGLSRLALEACDFTASLPVAGHVGSLNVAQAAAVFVYEWVRRTQEGR